LRTAFCGTRGNVLAWDHVIVGQSITTGTVFGEFQVKNGIDATAIEGMRDLSSEKNAVRRGTASLGRFKAEGCGTMSAWSPSSGLHSA